MIAHPVHRASRRRRVEARSTAEGGKRRFDPVAPSDRFDRILRGGMVATFPDLWCNLRVTPTPELITGILPAEQVSILAGASGAGKTTLIMQMVKQLQAGEDIFGHAVRPNLKIGYIAADRTWRAYMVLAEQIGVDIGGLKVRALIDDPDIDTEHFERNPLRLLTDLLQTLLPIDLVVVDPLVVFMGCDTRMYHQNAARLIKLNRWCRQHQVTILGTHHATKARTDYSFKRAQDRISGTSALLGFTSTQLFLSAPDETGELFHQWHIVSHHAAPDVIKLERSTTSGLFELAHPDDVKMVEVVGKDKPSSQAIATAVLTLLPPDGEKVHFQTLVDATTDIASLSLLKLVLKTLVDGGVIMRVGQGWYRRNLQ